MSISAFQVTSTTQDSDDDCIIVEAQKGRLVYSQNDSLDDEVDPSLAAFGVLIGSIHKPTPEPPKVKAEPVSDEEKKEGKEGDGDHRPVATKNHLLSHNRHGDPLDKVVSVSIHSSISLSRQFCSQS